MMVFPENYPAFETDFLRDDMNKAYRQNETEVVDFLLSKIELSPQILAAIEVRAKELVAQVRKKRMGTGGLDAFLYEYDLSSEEGIALMCLAEALLRIPDKETTDKLIKDKITTADWNRHLGQSSSFLVNAATWGLMLTGKILDNDPSKTTGVRSKLKRMIERTSEPVIRQAMAQAMKILGKQFVMGRSIEEAIKRARSDEARGYAYSYDMLGEAARTQKDAERYFESYRNAIIEVGKASAGKGVFRGPGISVKLSALHPRYEYTQRERVLKELIPKVLALALEAKAVDIGFTIDAEEADRLDLSLDVIEAVFCDPALNGWEGFGLAVQAYQKRAFYVLDWLAVLARKQQRRLMVRLVKGAYWDTEIKISQVQGFEGYPVFTRKMATDVSYLACAKKMLQAEDAFYPQFATHNAHTLATIMELAGPRRDFEFQCLHGMGHTLYDQIVGTTTNDYQCRIYAPVGSHEDLLAYLVRRLLENGANTSFVNRIIDESAPIDEIIEHPMTKLKPLAEKSHSKIPLPIHLFGNDRLNSSGLDLANREKSLSLADQLQIAVSKQWTAKPTTPGLNPSSAAKPVFSPIDNQHQIGSVITATAEETDYAIKVAHEASFEWNHRSIDERASLLEKAADLYEKHFVDLMARIVKEGGRTITDAISEIREAVDFCRYYAMCARKDLSIINLPGPTGEINRLQMKGRGTIACISPWNFPLAIFTGQVVAALVAGNCVIAKPAKQTPLVAALAVELLHEAGIPQEVVQLLPGSGAVIGARLLADERVHGVVLTGSTDTARTINQTLAARKGPIVPLIAETGGQNCMIVDSSALPEQVVADVLLSSFTSAGQRCSALRVLYLQRDIAPKIIEMLIGAMAEMKIGDPGFISTDIGPVIDHDAKKGLVEHFERMSKEAKLLYQIQLPTESTYGSYFAPCAFEINSIKQLTHEVFGPILHVIQFDSDKLDQVIADINETGYGLTMGIHSRIEETVEYICQHVNIGNIYVNRNMIGAVVGVQPFGGEGLSGTGPKAGGPHYLQRLCAEHTICINTTAAGGNASLMSLQEEGG